MDWGALEWVYTEVPLNFCEWAVKFTLGVFGHLVYWKFHTLGQCLLFCQWRRQSSYHRLPQPHSTASVTDQIDWLKLQEHMDPHMTVLNYQWPVSMAAFFSRWAKWSEWVLGWSIHHWVAICLRWMDPKYVENSTSFILETDTITIVQWAKGHWSW